MVDVTEQVQSAVLDSGMTDGILCVFVPHTTASVTINENADPDVIFDVIDALRENIPRRAAYRHAEGNSDAHVKSSLVGCSTTVIVQNGILQLGKWQSIYFAEFDGPRDRDCWVQCIEVDQKG